MSPSPVPNHSTWETIDIRDLSPSPQHAEREGGNESVPPPYSGYAHVPPFQREPQRPAEKAEEDDDDNSIIQTHLFPLPPSSHLPSNPSNRYHTFPAPRPPQLDDTPTITLADPFSTTTTTGTKSLNESGDPESCYFETLDFSDYLPSNPLDKHYGHHSDNHHQHSHNHSTKPFSHSAPTTTQQQQHEQYCPRRRRRNRYVHGGSMHTAREAMAVVCMVLLVAAAGVMAGYGVIRACGALSSWGAGQFGGSGGGGDGGGGDDQGGFKLCTAARPRFCHLIVGGDN
ncbi:hypothetical protein C8A00DRAFT_34251 [Chaetomidium leptoderma]|uniref:Uncharacterized protein n=1 Tax=Chaetomidium leptoderma TaxID=669021 RepID=A0AAN6ZWL1_9PEZI|nr:hypothetical protein C8A00DRAFT_34251 [Chaetomidium leptoderma]